jgi:hypothetical protein
VRGKRIGSDYWAKFKPLKVQRVRLNILDAIEGPTISEFQILAPKQK